MTFLHDCNRCRESKHVRVEPSDAGSAYGYVVYCDNCSGGEFEVSHGFTREKAIEAWNEDTDQRREDSTDPLPGNAR